MKKEHRVIKAERPVTYWLHPGEACNCIYALLGKNRAGEWVMEHYQKCGGCIDYHDGSKGLQGRTTEKAHPKDIKYALDNYRWRQVTKP